MNYIQFWTGTLPSHRLTALFVWLMRRARSFVSTVIKVTVAAAVVAGLGFVGLLIASRTDNTTRIHTKIWIKRPVDEVYHYVTTPANWPEWHPASLSVEGATDHALGVGEEVTEEFMTAGRRGRVVWTVVARTPPHYWSIEGKVAGSGGGGAITYTLSQSLEGTSFEREFVYGAPGVMFYVANKLRLRQLIASESEEALQRLKEVLESSTAR